GVVGFTLLCAALAVGVMLPGGLLVAWALARRQWPGKSAVETLVSLPLVMPPVATGLLLLRLLGRRGWLGRPLEELGLPIAFTWRAVVVAMAVMALPLFVRSARAPGARGGRSPCRSPVAGSSRACCSPSRERSASSAPPSSSPATSRA